MGGVFHGCAACTLFCSLLANLLPKAESVMRLLSAAYVPLFCLTNLSGRPDLEVKGGAGGFLTA